MVDVYGPNADFDSTEMNNPVLDTLPHTVAEGGAFQRCVSTVGAFDMHGNLHEWCVRPPCVCTAVGSPEPCAVCVHNLLLRRKTDVPCLCERLLLTPLALCRWVSDVAPNGHDQFHGGFFVDARLNGPGCVGTCT